MSAPESGYQTRRAEDRAKREAIEARMDPAELAFRLEWRRYRCKDEPWTATDTDDLERPLFITVSPGAYMDPACLMLVISGTPPRGVFVVMAGSYDPASWPIYILYGDRPKVINAEGPANGRALRRALLSLIDARGTIPAWKAEMPWQERYPQGEPEEKMK